MSFFLVICTENLNDFNTYREMISLVISIGRTAVDKIKSFVCTKLSYDCYCCSKCILLGSKVLYFRAYYLLNRCTNNLSVLKSRFLPVFIFCFVVGLF